MSHTRNRHRTADKHDFREERHDQQVLGSRKLRHAKRKMPISTLISTGLVIFGTLFVGLFVIELYQAKYNGLEKAAVTIKDSPADTGAEKTGESASQPVSADPSKTQILSGGDNASSNTATVNSGSTATSSNSIKNDKPASAAGKPDQPKSAERKPDAKQPTSGLKQGSGTPATASQQGGKPAASQTGSAGANPPAAKPKAEHYVVQKGDTLFSISRKYYGNNSGVERITRYNGIDPNGQLPEGKEIMIPLGKQ